MSSGHGLQDLPLKASPCELVIKKLQSLKTEKKPSLEDFAALSEQILALQKEMKVLRLGGAEQEGRSWGKGVRKWGELVEMGGRCMGQ